MDTIHGNGGSDTLNITATANQNGDVLEGADVSGVATINVHAITGGTDSLDASQVIGLTAVNADRATADLTVTNLDTGASAGIIGNGVVKNGNLTFGYANNTDAATLNVSGGTTAGNVTITSDPTSVSINSLEGAANKVGTVDLSKDGTATSLAIHAASNLTTGAISGFGAKASVTVDGAAAKVDIGTLDSHITSLNASGMTNGGVTATLNTTITSFTGGAGDDVITAAATTAKGAVIDAGAGNNTLVVDSAVNANDLATNGAAYKDFQVLENTSATTATTLDVTKVAGITSLETAAAGGGFSNMTAGQAANVTVSADLAGTATTYSLADDSGKSDILGLNFTNVNAKATAVENATNLVVNGFETLNLTAGSGGSSVFNTDGSQATAGTAYDEFAIGNATTDLQNVAIAGSYAAQVDLSANATKVVSIDASHDTAGVHIITGGQTGALTVTGSAAADIIDLGLMSSGGSQTINAGAGNDLIDGNQADIYAAHINGGDGVDTLAINDNGTINDQTFKNVSNVEKLAFNGSNALDFKVGGYADSHIAGANGGVLDVTAAYLTAGASIDASGLSGSNSLNLNLTDADAGTGAAISVLGSTAGHDSITISGSTGTGAVTVDESSNTVGVTIDVSGLTKAGTVTIDGSSAADTVKGGDVAATIDAGQGADTINLLTGHTGVQALDYANGDSTASGYDVVSHFGASDVVAFTDDALSLVAKGSFTALQTGVANLTASVNANGMITFGGSAATGLSVSTAIQAADALAGASGSDGGTDGFVLNGNTYVVEHHGTTTNVVELVGVSPATGMTVGVDTHSITLA